MQKLYGVIYSGDLCPQIVSILRPLGTAQRLLGYTIVPAKSPHARIDEATAAAMEELQHAVDDYMRWYRDKMARFQNRGQAFPCVSVRRDSSGMSYVDEYDECPDSAHVGEDEGIAILTNDGQLRDAGDDAEAGPSQGGTRAG